MAASTFRAVAQLLRSTSEACGKHVFCTQRTIWTLNLHNLLVVFSTAAPRDSALLLHVSVFSAMTEDPEMTYICVNCTMYIYWLILQAWFQWANFSKIWNVFFFVSFQFLTCKVFTFICPFAIRSHHGKAIDRDRLVRTARPPCCHGFGVSFLPRGRSKAGVNCEKDDTCETMWNNAKQCETTCSNICKEHTDHFIMMVCSTRLWI